MKRRVRKSRKGLDPSVAPEPLKYSSRIYKYYQDYARYHRALQRLLRALADYPHSLTVRGYVESALVSTEKMHISMVDSSRLIENVVKTLKQAERKR
jgi:hypothetical protein